METDRTVTATAAITFSPWSWMAWFAEVPRSLVRLNRRSVNLVWHQCIARNLEVRDLSLLISRVHVQLNARAPRQGARFGSSAVGTCQKVRNRSETTSGCSGRRARYSAIPREVGRACQSGPGVNGSRCWSRSFMAIVTYVSLAVARPVTDKYTSRKTRPTRCPSAVSVSIL